MIADHIPTTDAYPGMIRWKTRDGRSFSALGNPAIHADQVKERILQTIGVSGIDAASSGITQ